ncbi:hydrogenase maturation protein HypF [Paucidesulfovibrio gracilis DSM 16080]|uniref:Carbamoyltransferase n=2 Tax=Paucidesulfovibrio TaxID=2910985 RepID=A0A1T4W7Y9_9BACT|nr:hydrogenase maturation protein HypF [Paucidesulfovibrio gracilis DSM 16080]
MTRSMPNTIIRRRYVVNGQVQGVGFRPFVYRTALNNALTGSVRNGSEGVIIEVQGPAAAVDGFGNDLVHTLPPLARIVDLDVRELPEENGESEFRIRASSAGKGHSVLISPDMATCDDCLAEMRDPANRRYRYPFTNCTNCGPRWTITRSIPYDRPVTSMACFPMCPDCQAEYDDPLDRRFHAQPNACPVCGPKVWFTDAQGNTLEEGPAALDVLAKELAHGSGIIAAVKGLGGFHLVCDATSAQAVALLRERKNRPHKPLAVMVPDLNTARALAEIDEHAAALLQCRERPITLVRARPDTPLVPNISPDTPYVGLMLPYTPLHHVLLELFAEQGGTPALVMTSGNHGGDPICLGNREAVKRLAGVADRFLLHDRDILIRTDDSVLRPAPLASEERLPDQNSPLEERGLLFMRRARGFTPSPVFLPPARGNAAPCVLGTGPELKATLCLTKGDQAFPSQHIGNMNHLSVLEFYREIAVHLRGVLQVDPELIVHDLHPDYMTTREARELAESLGREQGRDPLPLRGLQHHMAHIHAVLAEHRHQGPVIGLALDGTGYGEDGTIWGGECLFVDSDTLESRRLAHFSPCALPGGEAAVREPWRVAQAMLWNLDEREPLPEQWSWYADHAQACRFLPQMLERGLNCPQTTSCGRLFDAVAALLGLTHAITYEGQAAILLEAAQDMRESTGYACPLLPALKPDAPTVLDTLRLFRACRDDLRNGASPGVVARRFHLGLITGLADMASHFATTEGLDHVALSGGVMQNLTLARELPHALKKRGLSPLTHRLVPPGDACISLGQAAWGRRLLQRRDNALTGTKADEGHTGPERG